MPVARTTNLPPKQTRFVAEYLINLNAKQAAIRAGYSPKTAEQQAYQLLQKTSVATAITEGKAKQLQRADLRAARVLEEYSRLALSDIGALFDDAGGLKPLGDLPPEVRAAIALVKASKKNLTAGDGVQGNIVEVKLWDKVRALEGLGKHFGLLVERVEVSGEVTPPREDSAGARVARAERGGP